MDITATAPQTAPLHSITLSKIRGLLPEAARVTRVTSQIGRSIEQTRYFASGKLIATANLYGRGSLQILYFRTFSGREVAVTDGNDLESILSEEFEALARSPVFAQWRQQIQNPPSQEQIDAWHGRLKELQEFVERSFRVPTHLTSPSENLWLRVGPQDEASILEIFVEEVGQPNAILRTGNVSSRIVLDDYDADFLALINRARDYLQSACQPQDWRKWEVQAISTHFETVDESLSTEVRIAVSAPDKPKVSAIREWASENRHLIVPHLKQAPSLKFDGDGIDSPLPSARFPEPAGLFDRISSVSISSQKSGEGWMIILEDSNR